MFMRTFWKLAAAAALGLALAAPAAADETNVTDFEYEPGEGVHQQEWYDPDDWFDEDADHAIDRERDDGPFEEDYDVYEYDEYQYDPYDYYTDDWLDTPGVFDGWYDSE